MWYESYNMIDAIKFCKEPKLPLLLFSVSSISNFDQSETTLDMDQSEYRLTLFIFKISFFPSGDILHD